MLCAGVGAGASSGCGGGAAAAAAPVAFCGDHDDSAMPDLEWLRVRLVICTLSAKSYHDSKPGRFQELFLARRRGIWGLEQYASGGQGSTRLEGRRRCGGIPSRTTGDAERREWTSAVCLLLPSYR